jgi:3-deoxy-D-manno-octulosonate 8-phosphate phosphatase (KDO 8-P phosphatase)
LNSVEDIFCGFGGEFLTPAEEIVKKLSSIKAFIFDWDGVFNAGVKGSGATSLYSEIDSMGLNLLRYGYWLMHGHLPIVAVITGQHNQSAFHLAEREHFDNVYFGFLHKAEALEHLSKAASIKPEEVAFSFDDVLDLALAKQCGLRFAVRNNAAPLFLNYVVGHQLVDYVTANSGQHHALREICEMILGITGKYNEVLEGRVAFEGKYFDYFQQRNTVKTKYFTRTASGIEERETLHLSM